MLRPNKIIKKIEKILQCNYTVFKKGSDPELLYEAYRASFETGRKNGFFPAILMLDLHTEGLLEYMEKKGSDKDSIIAGCRDNGKEILEERFDTFFEDYEHESMEDFIGDETEGEIVDRFVAYVDMHSNKLETDTVLLEIPVKNPWELVGCLSAGGWNDCPHTEDMIAICKYWYEKYKVVPAVFTQDIIEFYAPFKLNGQNSLEAAKEHYAFCPDRVNQGTETYTLSELAAGLEESDVWYFWWD